MVSTRLAPRSVNPARRSDGGMGSLRLNPTPPRPPRPAARPLREEEARDAGGRRFVIKCVWAGNVQVTESEGPKTQQYLNIHLPRRGLLPAPVASALVPPVAIITSVGVVVAVVPILPPVPAALPVIVAALPATCPQQPSHRLLLPALVSQPLPRVPGVPCPGTLRRQGFLALTNACSMMRLAATEMAGRCSCCNCSCVDSRQHCRRHQ